MFAGAFKHMQQSSQQAEEVLQRHQAAACTDVTGFGLLGHALEMARASEARPASFLHLRWLSILDGLLLGAHAQQESLQCAAWHTDAPSTSKVFSIARAAGLFALGLQERAHHGRRTGVCAPGCGLLAAASERQGV